MYIYIYIYIYIYVYINIYIYIYIIYVYIYIYIYISIDLCIARQGGVSLTPAAHLNVRNPPHARVVRVVVVDIVKELAREHDTARGGATEE